MYTLVKHVSINQSNTNDVILPLEENHGTTLRCLKQVLMFIMQLLQCRAFIHNRLLIS